MYVLIFHAAGSPRKAAASPDFKAAMEKMNPPIDYRDADDFQYF
jgi:hypothetical protein